MAFDICLVGCARLPVCLRRTSSVDNCCSQNITRLKEVIVMTGDDVDGH